ncbi:Nn.00g085900.m01.CDS01 [Neocucurbitaria sp. VM-36]
MASRALFSLRLHTPFLYTTRRTISITPRMLIKEDAHRSPEQLEKAKQEQLKEQQQGEGRWREDLASHGESNIAADKEEVNDHKAHMDKLQQETKRKGETGAI